MLSDLDEQEFQNLAASYQTLELDIYNVKRDIEAVLRIAARLKVCKDETVKGDAAIISSVFPTCVGVNHYTAYGPKVPAVGPLTVLKKEYEEEG